ncbi:STAS domain-containing protein [Stenomitos frigidus]|uniref:STAS domain-containing protein n=1 Tax=Stenomitos frigidus TaxID=1886765 RepID=UPI001C63B733|nr:STAS domain-containing protein [Stenomitos frigidus]
MIKIFKPVGILDRIQAKKLHLEVDNAIKAGSKIALIDMQAVTLIDSSALGELVVLLKAIRTKDGKLCFCSVGQQPKMVFELTGMEKVFHIFSDQEAFHQHQIAINPEHHLLR